MHAYFIYTRLNYCAIKEKMQEMLEYLNFIGFLLPGSGYDLMTPYILFIIY